MTNCKMETVFDRNAALVKKIQLGSDGKVATDLVLLYKQNLGFIVNCIKDYGLFVDRYADDYKQITYLALIKAVKDFKFDHGTKFLTYFRYWMQCYIYKFRRVSLHPLHVSEREITKFLKEELPQLSFFTMNEVLEREYSEKNYCGMEELDAIECQLYKNQIWEEARRMLSPDNYAMVHARFVEEVEFTVIAERFGITYDAARLRVRRSLIKLKKSPILKIFAQDLYGI